MACGAHSVTRTRSSSSRLVLGIRLTLGVCFRNTLFLFRAVPEAQPRRGVSQPTRVQPKGPGVHPGRATMGIFSTL